MTNRHGLLIHWMGSWTKVTMLEPCQKLKRTKTSFGNLNGDLSENIVSSHNYSAF